MGDGTAPPLLQRGLAWYLCGLMLLSLAPTPVRAEGAGKSEARTAAVPSEEVCSSGSATDPGLSLLDPPAGTADPAGVPGELSGPSAERPYWRRNLFGRFFRDQKYLFTTWWPSEIKREGFSLPLLGGIALATTSNRGSGEGSDLELQGYVQNESRGRSESVARKLSLLGDAASGAALIGTGYLIGRWSGNDRLSEASSLSAEALLSAGLWSSVVKLATARTRPAGGDRGKFFNYHPSRGQTVGSFPSGHATGAFTVATVFAHVYSDHKWVVWTSYGTATLIALSRVVLARHFPSDVIVGGILGNSFGRMAVARGEESAPSSTLAPSYDSAGRQAGIVWTKRW